MIYRRFTNLKLALAGCVAFGGSLAGVGSLAAAAPMTPIERVVSLAFDDQEQQDSRMVTFAHSDGQNRFALSLLPKLPAAQNQQSHVLILVDTSASQTGAFHKDSIAMARAIADGLNDEDRVRIAAVDLDAVPLGGDGYYGASSTELQQALSQLDQRTPLGATDLEQVFGWTINEFKSLDKSQPRHVIYIGDGVCGPSTFASEKFTKLVNELRDHQIPVSSFAIGPERNVELLSILANQTGGNVFLDSDDSGSADVAAAELVNTVRGNVFWPTTADSQGVLASTFPSRLVPLRSDRDSILLGTSSDLKPFEMSVQGEVNGQSISQSWTVTPESSDAQFSFLTYLVDQAQKDQGVRLPTVGSAGLREVAMVLDASSRAMLVMANDAAERGEQDVARTLVSAVVERVPGNARANRLQDGLADSLDAQDGAAGALGSPEAAENQAGANLIGMSDESQKSYVGLLNTYVNNEVKQAAERMKSNPELAVTRLKEVISSIENAADAPVETRQRLLSQLDVALSNAQKSAIEYRVDEQQRAIARATASERDEVLKSMEHQNTKVVRLVQQFDGLLRDIEHTQETSDLNRLINKVRETKQVTEESAPDTEIAASIGLTGHMQSAYRSSLIMNQKRLDMVYMLASVEESGLPFDDRLPYRYPNADEWHQKKMLRKKYERVALFEEGGNEQKINAALERSFDGNALKFNGASLNDFADRLMEFYGVNIRIDRKTLDDAGVDPDSGDITLPYSGIKLRNALKIALDELDLTYQVRDEVLTITTKEKAEESLVALVYDVADLVLPMAPLSGGITGGMGGGVGLGGGMGGMGMGGGMGNFGGGNGGMGGGMFNVQDTPAQKSNDDPATAVLSVTPVEGQSLETAWDSYFSTQFADADQVKYTARKLTADQNFAELRAMIRGAIRNQQSQPWMYQGLYVASVALGESQAEIERLLMTVMDWDNSRESAMNMAAFMADNQMASRSVRILQDLSARHPVWAQPYEVGLRAVRETQNVDDIQWAVTGILGQAWPNNPSIVKDATNLASATVVRLKSEGQAERAAELEKALIAALERDVIVRVSWTGSADLDLVVEEPTGAVCSHVIPRTISGGVMMKDAFPDPSSQDSKVYSEYYVCPKGIVGDYKAWIRVVKGQVAGGKVSVEIFRNFRNPLQTSQMKEIEIGDRPAYLVNFALEHGRRDASELAVQQALANQSATMEREAILALSGEELYEGSAQATDSTGTPIRNQLRGLNRNGVGYQPEISQIPSGPSWVGLAFTSYDRMYVFVNGTPRFMELIDFDTFTFVGGNAAGGGGAGGAGGGAGGLGGGLGGGLF